MELKSVLGHSMNPKTLFQTAKTISSKASSLKLYESNLKRLVEVVEKIGSATAFSVVDIGWHYAASGMCMCSLAGVGEGRLIGMREYRVAGAVGGRRSELSLQNVAEGVSIGLKNEWDGWCNFIGWCEEMNTSAESSTGTYYKILESQEGRWMALCIELRML